MVSADVESLLKTISTTEALINQFQRSLGLGSGPSSTDDASSTSDLPAPLTLLRVAAEDVKSQVGKLTLLAINLPFSPTAITKILKEWNGSVLPSLVTAGLLITPQDFIASFSDEARALIQTSLVEILPYLNLIKTQAKDEFGDQERAKKSLLEATGRVQGTCDALARFATADIPGFVVRKAEGWLALMKDAVKELEEWDPEEEVDHDDPFGIMADVNEVGAGGADEKKKDADQATIAAGVKEQALKVLSRIPQSIHVVVKQRLAKMPKAEDLTVKHKKTLKTVLKNTKRISESIDEAAECMYLGNPEQCLKKAGEARALTIDVVESVKESWTGREKGAEESKEDKYIGRALLWIQQVDTG